MTHLYKSILLLPLNRMSCRICCSLQQFYICGLAAEQTSTPVATTIYRDNTKPLWQSLQQYTASCFRENTLTVVTIAAEKLEPVW